MVTGGAGYIGSHIVNDLIENNYEVIVLDNMSTGNKNNIHPDSIFIVGDIKDDNTLQNVFSHNVDAVFHFAAHKAVGESMMNPMKYAVNNISGTINLLKKAVEHGVKNFIFSSSAAVYGPPVFLPITEEHPLNPMNYYGYTKVAIEENLKWFSELTDLRYAALRYFNATGYDIRGRVKGQEKNPANLCPVIMETLCGMREQMEVFGDDYDTPDGTCIRDYIHVNDLSTAHLKALEYIKEEKKNLVVNLGTGNGYSVTELINAAEKVSEKKVNYKISGRRAGDPANLISDYSLAKKLMNWEAVYSDPETIFKSMLGVYFNKM
ncbi:MAG: UDP-glucose 4-epimerase GalE [bacterium]